MKLIERDKREFRNCIEEFLKYMNLREGERIKIDEKLLEELIFRIQSDGKTKKVVWTADGNLDKIDLSEISFDQVDWYDENYVDMKNTNAKIDFQKSASSGIKNCNFSGTDLSESNIDIITDLISCNLSATNIKMSFKNIKQLFNVDFSDNDFSNIEVDINDFSRFINISNFSNTGIHLTLKRVDSKVEITQKAKRDLASHIKMGYLNNCYVNGVRISSLEEQKIRRKEMQKKYNTLKNNYRSVLTKTLTLHMKG